MIQWKLYNCFLQEQSSINSFCKVWFLVDPGDKPVLLSHCTPLFIIIIKTFINTHSLYSFIKIFLFLSLKNKAILLVKINSITVLLIDHYDINKISVMKSQISNSKLWQTNGISALAFSHDGNYCALATKQDHTVRLYKVNTLNQVDSWTPLQQFSEHTQTVSDIDWAADRKIVTSSHDRSVVAWRQISDVKWEKMLVNIDIKLSILVAKWAPSTRKFALGSACNTLAISYFNNLQNCWVITSKNNLTKAPITTLSFHPSSNLLAVGSADFSVKIVTSSFRDSKDPLIMNSKVEDYQYNGAFKDIKSMFDVLFFIDSLGGWINHISFQNNGNSLLVIPHHNHIKLYQIADNQNVVAAQEDIQWNGLPFLSGFANNNKELILGGFNKKVARFVKKGKYTFESYLGVNEKTNSGKVKKGLVTNFAKNIQTNKSIYSQAPTESDHVNSIKVVDVRGVPVSYDANGVVHFWSG